MDKKKPGRCFYSPQNLTGRKTVLGKHQPHLPASEFPQDPSLQPQPAPSSCSPQKAPVISAAEQPQLQPGAGLFSHCCVHQQPGVSIFTPWEGELR